MFNVLLRAAVGGFVAALLTMLATRYLLQPERSPSRRAESESTADDLTEAQQEQLLRELGALT